MHCLEVRPISGDGVEVVDIVTRDTQGHIVRRCLGVVADENAWLTVSHCLPPGQASSWRMCGLESIVSAHAEPNTEIVQLGLRQAERTHILENAFSVPQSLPVRQAVRMPEGDVISWRSGWIVGDIGRSILVEGDGLGPCPGDSGGPVVLEGTPERVLGLLVAGSAGCNGTDIYAKLD